MPKLLTTEQRLRFASKGIVFPIRVLSLTEAELYLSACDALEVSLGGRPRTVEVRQMHLHFGWAYRLASHRRILDAVEDLLGPNLLIWATELFAKHPRDAAVSIAWHRDGAYMGLDAQRTLTAWLALTDSTPENGGMRIACEPNRAEYLRLQGPKSSVTGRNMPDPPEEKTRHVLLSAGEMSLHDVHVLHGSGPNRSDHKRMGFAIRFTTPETCPANNRSPAILVRGEDRYGHFDLQPPPTEEDSHSALRGMQCSARRHLDATLRNLTLATR